MKCWGKLREIYNQEPVLHEEKKGENDQSNYSDCVLFFLNHLHLGLVFKYLIWRQKGYGFIGLRIIVLDYRCCSSSTTGQKIEEVIFTATSLPFIRTIKPEMNIIWSVAIIKLYCCSSSCYLFLQPEAVLNNMSTENNLEKITVILGIWLHFGKFFRQNTDECNCTLPLK